MSSAQNLSWQEALQRLKDGNERYSAEKQTNPNNSSKRRQSLTGHQAPFAIILGCADSRVVPELAFDMGIGDIFTVRVAGNIANTASLGSIEYAVAHLGVNLIVVLGHESCGAVTAAINGGDNGYSLNHLVAEIVPAIGASKDKSVNAVVKKNAEMNAAQIISRSPIIQQVMKTRDIKVVPAYYSLGSGRIEFLEETV
jgi:carbonic anhydrase